MNLHTSASVGTNAPGRAARPRSGGTRKSAEVPFRRRLPEVRPSLVTEAKARLASGFYDLPECLELAVDQMIAREGCGA